MLSKIGLKSLTNLSGVLLAASMAFPSTAFQVKITKESKIDKVQAGYYRMKVGDIEIISLSDGTITSDVQKSPAPSSK